MARCIQYNYETDGTPDDGIWFEVYQRVDTPLSDCGKNNVNEVVVIGSHEFIELQALAGQTVTLDSAIAAMDGAEVSAVFTTAFAIIFKMSALAYKISVAKNTISKS